MTELIPKLYIGNWHEARAAQGFYIVTVASDSLFQGDAFFPLIDGPGNSQELFDSAVDTVVKLYPKMDRVLVHCIGGRSRSAAVIVAAATRLTKRPFCEVYDELLRLHDFTGGGARIHPHLSTLLLKNIGE